MHEAEDSIAVGSCTAALHLILHALGIGPGDEVLVPSLTFVATANSVLYVGARPVFVDIGSAEVPLMSLDEAEAKYTARTKAVILVHFAGYLAHRDAWQSFARRKGLLLIEDAAHAAGLPAVGTYGEAAAFSFYGNKNMTTAEGGAIIAHSHALRETIRRARSHGMTSGTRQRLTSRRPDYDVTILGFNYRMDQLRAALGLAQLKQLREWNDIRRRLSQSDRQLIAEHCPSVMVPFERSPSPSSASSADPDRRHAAVRLQRLYRTVYMEIAELCLSFRNRVNMRASQGPLRQHDWILICDIDFLTPDFSHIGM
jgi:dTDP-4-amino-4,6-dideoxygalactose transaminase